MNRISHYLKNINTSYNYALSVKDNQIEKLPLPSTAVATDRFHKFNRAERFGNAFLTPLAKTVAWIEGDIQSLRVKPRPSIIREIILCGKIAFKILLGIILSIPAAIGFCVKHMGEKNSPLYKQLRKNDFKLQKLISTLKMDYERVDSAKSDIKRIKNAFDIGENSIESIDNVVYLAICFRVGINHYHPPLVTTAMSNQPIVGGDACYPGQRRIDSQQVQKGDIRYIKRAPKVNLEEKQKLEAQNAEKEPEFRKMLAEFSEEWKKYCDCLIANKTAEKHKLLSILGHDSVGTAIPADQFSLGN
jgi:hypothetical protein